MIFSLIDLKKLNYQVQHDQLFLLSIYRDLYTKIDDFTGGRLTEFIDGIKGLGPMIIEKSQEFYKTIDDWTGGKISGAFDWIGKNVITPMGDFFKEKIDYVGTKAGELWTNFSSSFLNFFGDIKFELPELPDLGVTEALGLTPQIEGPDLTQDLVAIGGSTAANIAPVSGAKGMAVEGMDAAQVANQIPNMNVGGKSVQLGTGLSQGGTSEDVQKQISGLREGGAKGVQVLGTGNSEKDATLQQIVEQNKDLATFLPAAKSDTGSIDYKATALNIFLNTFPTVSIIPLNVFKIPSIRPLIAFKVALLNLLKNI